MGNKQSGTSRSIFFLFTCLLVVPILISGCGHLNEASQARPVFQEANTLFNQGNYQASLSRYQHLIEKYPNLADRGLFEMGIIFTYSENKGKDYQKALDCFQKIIRQYPESGFRKDSEIMLFQISNIIIKDTEHDIGIAMDNINQASHARMRKGRIADHRYGRLEPGIGRLLVRPRNNLTRLLSEIITETMLD